MNPMQDDKPDIKLSPEDYRRIYEQLWQQVLMARLKTLRDPERYTRGLQHLMEQFREECATTPADFERFVLSLPGFKTQHEAHMRAIEQAMQIRLADGPTLRGRRWITEPVCPCGHLWTAHSGNALLECTSSGCRCDGYVFPPDGL